MVFFQINWFWTLNIDLITKIWNLCYLNLWIWYSRGYEKRLRGIFDQFSYIILDPWNSNLELSLVIIWSLQVSNHEDDKLKAAKFQDMFHLSKNIPKHIELFAPSVWKKNNPFEFTKCLHLIHLSKDDIFWNLATFTW